MKKTFIKKRFLLVFQNDFSKRFKLDLDFGMPDPYPKDVTGRFAHVGRTCVAREATGRREQKP